MEGEILTFSLAEPRWFIITRNNGESFFFADLWGLEESSAFAFSHWCSSPPAYLRFAECVDSLTWSNKTIMILGLLNEFLSRCQKMLAVKRARCSLLESTGKTDVCVFIKKITGIGLKMYHDTSVALLPWKWNL